MCFFFFFFLPCAYQVFPVLYESLVSCSWVSQTYMLFSLCQLLIATLQTTTLEWLKMTMCIISSDSLSWQGSAGHLFCSLGYGPRSCGSSIQLGTLPGLQYLRWPLILENLSPCGLLSFGSLTQAPLQHGSWLPDDSILRKQIPMWKCLSCLCLPMPVNIQLAKASFG